MKRLTKYEIACMIERLSGNRPWSLLSLISLSVDNYTRSELVDKYNQIIAARGLVLNGYQFIS